jgi:ubiquitin C-terminal hydrolase
MTACQKGILGFHNFNSSCYLNSILGCLLSTEWFNTFLSDYESNKLNDSEFCNNLLHDLDNHTSNKIFKPTNTKKWCESKMGTGMQCTHELLMFIMDDIEKHHASDDLTLHVKLMIKCDNCDRHSFNRTTFKIWNVENNDTIINALIKNTCDVDKIEKYNCTKKCQMCESSDVVNCNNCSGVSCEQKNVKATKSIVGLKFPKKLLTISIQRINNTKPNNVKISKKIKMYDNVYNLRAVSIHAHNHHFSVVCTNKSNEWLLIDDENVRKINDKKANDLFLHAYLLFYEK